MNALESNRLCDLLAARRALRRAALALGCAPVLLTVLAGASAHALVVLALPLLPLLLLMLIASGVLDAGVRELTRVDEPGADFPNPVLCRG